MKGRKGREGMLTRSQSDMTCAVAYCSMKLANPSFNHKSFHHFIVTRFPNHWCANSWMTTVATDSWAVVVDLRGLYNTNWSRNVISPQFSMAPAAKSLTPRISKHSSFRFKLPIRKKERKNLVWVEEMESWRTSPNSSIPALPSPTRNGHLRSVRMEWTPTPAHHFTSLLYPQERRKKKKKDTWVPDSVWLETFAKSFTEIARR